MSDLYGLVLIELWKIVMIYVCVELQVVMFSVVIELRIARLGLSDSMQGVVCGA